jgi:hypothetical protein
MKRALGTIGAAITTFLFSGTIPAWARPLDEPEIGGPFPAAPAVQTQASGTSAWIIGLIVAAAVVVLTVALIGTVRLYRSRSHAVPAGA